MFDIVGVITSFIALGAALMCIVAMLRKRDNVVIATALLAAWMYGISLAATVMDPNDGAADIAVGVFNFAVWMVILTMNVNKAARKARP